MGEFRISSEDKLIIALLKLTYLIPYVIISYPFWVLIHGVREIGNPFDGMLSILKEKRNN